MSDVLWAENQRLKAAVAELREQLAEAITRAERAEAENAQLRAGIGEINRRGGWADALKEDE